MLDVDENEHDAAPPMPIIFEQTVAVDVHSPDGNKDTFKFKYVQEEEFARIVKQVKRKKKKELEDREWSKLIRGRKTACKYNMENDKSRSLTSSTSSISTQDVLQKYCDVCVKQAVSGHVHDDGQKYFGAGLKQPVFEHVHDCQKYCDALCKEVGAEAYGGTVLDISDTGNGEEICSREENVSVIQTTNTENVQMIKFLQHPIFNNNKHSSNAPPETIQEKSLCLPNSHCYMLNSTECLYQQMPCHMNKTYKADMPKSWDCHILEKKEHNILPSVVSELNTYAINKESIISQRITFMWKKMNAAFDDILYLYNKIPEPDGSQDLMRRCKRAAEFSCRFSRNYLYQLQQQVCSLKKQIGESSPLSTAQHTFHQLVCQKLVVAHHSALQGLQAYLHHMPNSVQCAASDKLKELLHYICELSRLCSRVGIMIADSACELGPEYIEKKSKALLQVVKSKKAVHIYEDGLLASRGSTANIMTTAGSRGWDNSLQESEQTQVPMISASRQYSAKKIIPWKESAAKLARAAYGSSAKKSGYVVLKRNRRFTVYKDGPPMQCESELKVSCDSASVVDMRDLSNKVRGICEEEFQNKLMSVLRILVDKLEAETSQGSVKKLDEQSSVPVDDTNPVLQQVNNTTSHPLQQRKNQHTTQRKDEMKVTKTGPHNAQLIFLPPDPHDAWLDPEDNKESKVTILRSQDTTFISETSDSVDHTGLCKHKSRACCKLKPNVQILDSVNSKRNLSYQHSPEASAKLHCFKEPSRKTTCANIKENVGEKQSKSKLQSPLTLPKKLIQSAVNYHHKFHSYMKSNPMYESTSPPWIMISRLSDQLIQHVLQEVARETKLESVIQNIYALELK